MLGAAPNNVANDSDTEQYREELRAYFAEADKPKPDEYVFANGEGSGLTVAEVAHHEAGHAIAVVALGYRLFSATIQSGAPMVLHVTDVPYRDSRVIRLAGPLAEHMPKRRFVRPLDDEILPFIRRSWGYQPLNNDWLGFFIDARRELFRTGHPHFFGVEAQLAEFRRAEEATMSFLKIPQHRMAICAVATALLERGTLDGDAVRQIAGRYINLEILEPSNGKKAA